jgi:Mlc titration factor MtfA (ptsG expression regulator)
MAAGEADGIPRFHPRLHDRALRSAWPQVLERSFDDFAELVDRFEEAFPRHLDPESAAGLALYDRLPLDPYASTDPAEFFAVSSEVWFTDPLRLASTMPQWSELLRRYYRPRS